MSDDTSFDRSKWEEMMEKDGLRPAIYVQRNPPSNEYKSAKFDYVALFDNADECLNRDVVADGKIHPNQIAAAVEIFCAAMNGSSLHRKNAVILLAAQTQSGKTGIQAACHYLFDTFMLEEQEQIMGISVISRLALQLPNDISLLDQNKFRFIQFRNLKPTIFGRSGIGILKKKAELWAKKINQAASASEKQKIYEQIRSIHLRRGFEKAPIITPNTFVTIDESHYGTSELSVMNEILKCSGIDFQKNPDEWETEGVIFATFSATPVAQVIIEAKQPWVHKLVARPGSGYTGILDLLKKDRIKEAFNLRDRNATARFATILDDHLLSADKKGTPSFGIVRMPTRGYESKKQMIVEELREKGKKVLENGCFPTSSDSKKYDLAIVELNERTPEDIRAGLCSPDSDDYDGSAGWLSEPPPMPTLVIVKEMLKMGASVCGDHIGFAFDRVSKKPLADFIGQSLVGRSTGYGRAAQKFPIYTHLQSVNDLARWVISGYESDSSPPRATRAQTRVLKGYPNFGQEFIFNLPVGKRLRSRETYGPLLEAAIQAATDSDLEDRLRDLSNSSSTYRRYHLNEWKATTQSKDIIRGSENEISTMTGAWLQKSPAACFIIDYDEETGKIKLFWNFDQDEEEVPIQISTSMYGSLAAK